MKNHFLVANIARKKEYFKKLKESECRILKLTKRCEGNNMKCDEEKCEFDGTPKNEFKWWGKTIQIGYQCIIKHIRVFARNKNDKIFTNYCHVSDLYCVLEKKTIIWDKSIIYDCPYVYINTMKDTKEDLDYIVDKINGWALRVVNESKSCVIENVTIELHYTQEGLYLSTNIESKKLINNSTTFDKIKYDLILSELDGLTYNELRNSRELQKHICETNKHALRNLRFSKNTFELVNYDTRNPSVIFINHNLLILAECRKVNNLIVKENIEECYEGIEIIIKDLNVRGFLLNSQIITNNVAKINCIIEFCSFIHTNNILICRNNKVITITQLKNNINIFEINNLFLKSIQHYPFLTNDEKTKNNFLLNHENSPLNAMEEITHNIYTEDNILSSITDSIYSFILKFKSMFLIISYVCGIIILLIFICIFQSTCKRIFVCFTLFRKDKKIIKKVSSPNVNNDSISLVSFSDNFKNLFK